VFSVVSLSHSPQQHNSSIVNYAIIAKLNTPTQ
jgi:hypothetical protein